MEFKIRDKFSTFLEYLLLSSYPYNFIETNGGGSSHCGMLGTRSIETVILATLVPQILAAMFKRRRRRNHRIKPERTWNSTSWPRLLQAGLSLGASPAVGAGRGQTGNLSPWFWLHDPEPQAFPPGMWSDNLCARPGMDMRASGHCWATDSSPLLSQHCYHLIVRISCQRLLCLRLNETKSSSY